MDIQVLAAVFVFVFVPQSLCLEYCRLGREMGAWVWCSCSWIRFVPGGVGVCFYEKEVVLS